MGGVKYVQNKLYRLSGPYNFTPIDVQAPRQPRYVGSREQDRSF